MALSYSQGIGHHPAAGGDDRGELRPRRRRVPRPRRADRAPSGRAAELPRAGRERRRHRARARSARPRQGRPPRHLGAELRGVGPRPVRDREARRDPRQHQPRLPHDRAGLRAAPVGLQGADRRARVQGLRLPRDGRRGPRRPARARARVLPRRRGPRTAAAARPDEIEWPELDFDEPINIQYTSGTTGSPKGATLSHHNILNNGFFVGEFCGYTEQDRVCIPVPFYHCFGMVMGNLGRRHPRRLHGHPGAGLRAAGDARGGRRGALHEPLRRADDVHRRARAPRLRLLRPELAAHGDHGRLAVPRARSCARSSTACTWRA